mgnify:CR=1 FL=1
MACILPLQGRRTNLPCYHLALRLPRGKAPQRVGCYPSSSITAGLCRRSLAYYYKVSSVRSSKTMFGSALRVPLSPPGTRFDVPHCVLFSSLLLNRCAQENSVFLYTVLFYYIGEGLSNLFAVQYARRCLKKSLDNSGSEV